MACPMALRWYQKQRRTPVSSFRPECGSQSVPSQCFACVPRHGRRRVQAMGTEGLDAPMPGQLLVLLSRLHRSETARARPDDEALG